MHKQQEEFIDIEAEDDEIDYEDGDFGFIIGADGVLKSMMIPDDLMEDPPKEIQRILKIFGIKNIHTIDSRTLH
ncbi:hypothetical protein EB118_18735 [bacterium]|nr:hypothetical protein [Synechococcaceae bacterium WB6_1A_059]NDG32097.1 hypothetical protein [bacterium]NDG79789.1 hypothetical protein [Synechococcaceae bacterium WB8_1B_057]